jgi:hypothetical protein
MFAVHCPRHNARVLIWTSMVDRVVNTSEGIVVHYHCTCGHRGLWVTGQLARRERTPQTQGSDGSHTLVSKLSAASQETAYAPSHLQINDAP